MERTSRIIFQTVLLTTAVVAALLLMLRHLERTRKIEGVWLWQFEGSKFYEGTQPRNPCNLLKNHGAWLSYDPEKLLGGYDYRKKYPSSGVYINQYGFYRIEAFSVSFIGSQKFSLFGSGHLNSWRSEYNVHQMLSAKPISALRCELPFP